MRKKTKKSTVFSTLCRLCLAISDNLVDITSEEFDFDIVDLVFDSLDIKFVKQNPVFPNQFICLECLDICQFIKKFKEGCKSSLETLTKYVIQEFPKDVTEICWTGDRKKLKELMAEVNSVHEESLVVQAEHYKELFQASCRGKEQDIVKKEVEEIEEVKNEIKQEDIEVNVDGIDFDVIYDDANDIQDGSDLDQEGTVEMLVEETEVDSPKGKKSYKKYQCEICLKYFDGYDFKYHMNTHLKIFPFRCEEEDCDRKFTSPGNLAAHKKASHDEKTLKLEIKQETLIPCDRCGLSFTRKQLYNHFKKDHSDQQYKCEEPDCGQVFVNLLRLKKHQKRAHFGTPKQKYTCELCGKAFRKTRLKYHMNIHLNIKPFVCDFEGCNKACPDPGQLAVHKRIIHLKTIKIVCKVCGKPFKTKADHDIHITYHGNPSMPCQICGRLLMNRKTMAKHMLTHTGEKKYKCTFEGCTRAFPVSTGLTVHMRSHTKEKPYACEDCSEKFAYRIGLRRHAQKIHGKIV